MYNFLYHCRNAPNQILLEVNRFEDKENIKPRYNTDEESGIYEQLSVVMDTQSLYYQHRNPAPITRDLGGLYGSFPHQVGPSSLNGSSHSLQNVYATYHDNQNHMGPGCPQQPFPYYMSRNGKMYSSVPTRRKQGYVPMETPSRSSPIYADLKTLPDMKEQWVDFGPSGSDKEESTEYGLILSDKTNHVNLTQTKTVGNNKQVRSSSVFGGLLPMKNPLPAIEEDLCDCSAAESDIKTRSYKSCRSAGSCKSCGFTSQEDGNTDYLSVSNSDSLERITPLPDITQSLEVKYLYVCQNTM